MKKTIFTAIALLLACNQGFADNQREINYEDSLIDIYKYIIEHKTDVVPYRIDFNTDKKIVIDPKTNHINESNVEFVKAIKAATESHQLVLKSIAYQPEWKNEGKCADDICDAEIRVTWADKENNIIVKALYNLDTDKDSKSLALKTDNYRDAPSQLDFTLHHSFYADKNQIDNIKVMYRKNKNSEYQYFEIDKIDLKYHKILKGPDYAFKELGYKHCISCHTLAPDAKNNSKDGPFFPRFQYGNPLEKQIIQMASYPELVVNDQKLTRKADEVSKLGLPNMSGDFIHQTITVSKDGKMSNATLNRGADKSNDFNTLYMNPDILQNNAILEGKSICLSIKYEASPNTHSYLCANMVTRSILSKMEKDNNGSSVSKNSSY